MRYGRRISIVIPTLDEEACLPKLLRSLPAYVDEVIVVDGYSKDQTVRLAKKFGARVIYDNIGKGSALIKGVKESTGEYIIMMDADLSHRPSEIENMLTSLYEGYDVCMGSRFMRGGRSNDISPLRSAGNKLFIWLVNTLFGASYTDLCYGYRAFTRKAFDKLVLRSRRFAIETEISIKAAKHRLKVCEVPSFEKKRSSGEAKLKTFHDGWEILKLIIRERIEK